MKNINIFSALTLENWDEITPLVRGIGGSETCHVELHKNLRSKGFPVRSFAPVENETFDWVRSEKVDDYLDSPQNWLVFRDPAFFDKDLPEGGNYIFIAQDVDYDWTEERLKKVSKYICLCDTHVQFTEQKYPILKDKIYLSTNGIRSDFIRSLSLNPPNRNPNKLIYSSSPDRGLHLILKNWFRIRERCPQAELHIFYGFNNMEKMLELMGGRAWFSDMKNDIERLVNQDGIHFRGRVNQEELYKEYLSSNIWFYPTDWPETSCITCMEAQALGAIPVTNKYWALRQNVFHGYVYDGVPQKDNLCKSFQISKVCDLINNPNVSWRNEMMEDALDTFDWKKITNQYIGWME